jgi:F0F1-type ATP synthase assembly protein I
MAWSLGDSKEVRFYLSLAQVGTEFVAPLVIGVMLDRYLGWSPWGVVIGGLLGFVGGMVHLLTLAGRQPPEEGPHSRKDGRL